METASTFDTIFAQTTRIFIPFFIIFAVLGLLVIMGFGKEVKLFLISLFRGVMRIFAVARFIKMLLLEILHIFQAILLYISPILALIIVSYAYYGIMYFYKFVGRTNDLTGMTIVITILLTIVIKMFPNDTRPKSAMPNFGQIWWGRFSRFLFDFFEIMVFIFFLTLDIIEIPFLPKDLWIHLHANLAEFDLMVRGIHFNNTFTFTLWLAGLALFVEFIRFAFRIVQRARFYYVTLHTQQPSKSRIDVFEQAVSESFYYSLANLVTFFGYTTVVTVAFFSFPRLKLISLVFFSLTSLVIDIFSPVKEPVNEDAQDFLTKVIIRTLNLKHEGDQDALAVKAAAKVREFVLGFAHHS